MRIRQFDLVAFGQFTNYRLDFGTGAGLHVIYGLNEAGKSTCMRALSGLLYGIPGNTADGFVHPMKNLRLSGWLETDEGESAHFVRRKGNGDTLVGVNGEAVPEVEIERFLGKEPKLVFERHFHMDHAALVRGGAELLDSKGDAGRALFEAGTGSHSLQGLLKQLDTQCEELFKPGGSKPLVNAALRQHKDAADLSKKLELKPQTWLQQEKELEQTRLRLQQMAEERAAIRSQLGRLQRLQTALPVAGGLASLTAEITAMGAVTTLPENSAALREKAIEKAAASSQNARELEIELQNLAARLELLVLAPDLLAQEESVNRVHSQLASYLEAREQLPGLTHQLVVVGTKLQPLLAGPGRGLAPEVLQRLRPQPEQGVAVRQLLQQRSALHEADRAAQESVEINAAALKATGQALEQLPPLCDHSGLTRVLERAQGALKDERLTNELCAQIEYQKAQLEADARALHPEATGWEQVDELAVPSSIVIAEFRDSWQEMEARGRALAEEKTKLALELQAHEQARKVLYAGRSIPSLVDLQTARQCRDALWEALRPVLLAPASTRSAQPGEVREFEVAVALADSLADALRTEARLVAEAAQLEAEILAAQQKQRDWSQACTAHESTRESWNLRWHETTAPCGTSTLMPPAMAEWKARHESLRHAATDLRSATSRLPLLQQPCKQWLQDLQRELTALGLEAHCQGESLTAVEQRARAAHAALQEQKARREELRGELDRLTAEQTRLASVRAGVVQKLEAWRRQWDGAVAPFDALAAEPADFETQLTGLSALYQALDDQAAVHERRERLGQIVQIFEADVTQLVAAVAPNLELLAPELAANALFTQCAAARTAATAHKATLNEQEGAAARLAQAHNEKTQAEEQLRQLMERAGCGDLETLSQLEQRSQRWAQLNRDAAQSSKTLASHAAGAPVEQLLAELQQTSAETLVEHIASLQEKLDELEEERGRAEGDKRVLTLEVEDAQAADDALSAAQEAAEAATRIRDGVLTYVQTRLAREILGRQIELYRAQNQGPIIQRANEVFGRLTDGAYHSLKIGVGDKDAPVLLGVRGQHEEVQVSAMSDGTRDQLYLALRLASLHLQLDSMPEALPLVVDDILINFDDRRAKATLEVLGELGQRTQVLFFTHHHRLEELAKEALPGRVQVHRMDRLSQPHAGAAGSETFIFQGAGAL